MPPSPDPAPSVHGSAPGFDPAHPLIPGPDRGRRPSSAPVRDRRSGWGRTAGYPKFSTSAAPGSPPAAAIAARASVTNPSNP